VAILAISIRDLQVQAIQELIRIRLMREDRLEQWGQAYMRDAVLMHFSLSLFVSLQYLGNLLFSLQWADARFCARTALLLCGESLS